MLETVWGMCAVYVGVWLWPDSTEIQQLSCRQRLFPILVFDLRLSLSLFRTYAEGLQSHTNKLDTHTHPHTPSQCESGKHSPAYGWCYQEAFGGWLFPHVVPALSASGNKNNLQVRMVPAVRLHLSSVISWSLFTSFSSLLSCLPTPFHFLSSCLLSNNIPFSSFQVFLLLPALSVVMPVFFIQRSTELIFLRQTIWRKNSLTKVWEDFEKKELKCFIYRRERHHGVLLFFTWKKSVFGNCWATICSEK